VAVPRKDTLKTAAGSRVLVAPAKLMDLLRVAIEAFHTDPTTGAVDPTDRLVPGYENANSAGQQGYQSALEDASTRSISVATTSGFECRATFCVRAWPPTWLGTPVSKTQFVGASWDTRGEDVFGRIYTLDIPRSRRLVEVAAMLEGNIVGSIGR